MKFIALAFSCLLMFSCLPMQMTQIPSRRWSHWPKGDAEAQYHVGMMHNNGIGTQQRSQAGIRVVSEIDRIQRSAGSLQAWLLLCRAIRGRCKLTQMKP